MRVWWAGREVKGTWEGHMGEGRIGGKGVRKDFSNGAINNEMLPRGEEDGGKEQRGVKGALTRSREEGCTGRGCQYGKGRGKWEAEGRGGGGGMVQLRDGCTTAALLCV